MTTIVRFIGTARYVALPSSCFGLVEDRMRIYPAHRPGGWKPGVRFVGVMGAAILAITGCGNGNPTTNTNTAVVKGSGGAVVVRLPADWNTLDPQQAYGFNSGEVGLAAYDRLLSWGPAA